MRRKQWTAVLLAGLLAMLLTACGNSDSPYLGTWTAAEYTTEGVTVSAEQLGESTLTFHEDGTLTANFLGTEAQGEWKENDTGVRITSDVELDCVSDGQTLTLDYGGMAITFEKAASDTDGAEGGEAADDGAETENAESDSAN